LNNELLLECTHFSYMIDNKIYLNEEITLSNKDYINYMLGMDRTSKVDFTREEEGDYFISAI